MGRAGRNRSADSWEAPRRLLEAYSRGDSLEDREALEKWAYAQGGEEQCLVLAKGCLLEAFHTVHRFLTDGPIIAVDLSPEDKRRMVASEIDVIDELLRAYEHAAHAAKHFRSLEGLVLAANILHICRGRGTMVLATRRMGLCSELISLLRKARDVGDSYWRDPQQSPQIWEEFPWEVAPRRSASSRSRVARDVERRLQATLVDERRAASVGGDAAQLVDKPFSSVEDLAHSLVSPVQVRMATLEDCLFTSGLRAQLFRLLLAQGKKCGDARTSARVAFGGQKMPQHLVAQHAQRQADVRYRAVDLQVQLGMRLEQRRAKAAVGQSAHRGAAVASAAAGGALAPPDGVRGFIQQKLEEAVASKQAANVEEAVRQVASLRLDQLTKEASSLEKSRELTSEQAQYVRHLVERVRKGAPAAYRWSLPLPPGLGGSGMAGMEGGVSNGSSSSGGGSSMDAGGVSPVLVNPTRFQQLLQEHFEAGGAIAACEDLCSSMPWLRLLAGHIDDLHRQYVEKRPNGSDSDEEQKGGGTWPRLQLATAEQHDVDTIRLLQHDLDSQLYSELQRTGPNGFSAQVVLSCVPSCRTIAFASKGGSERDDLLTPLDWEQYNFYDCHEGQLEAAVPLCLPVSLDYDLRHPGGHKWGLERAPLGLLRGALARALLGRHMLRMLERQQLGNALALEAVQALQAALHTPHISPQDVLAALEPSAVHAVGSVVVNTLLDDYSARFTNKGAHQPRLVLCGARMLLALQAAEQHQMRDWSETSWVEKAKLRLLRPLLAGLRQLSIRQRLTEHMVGYLVGFTRGAVAMAVGIPEDKVKGDPKDLNAALRQLGMLPLPALAQVYCAVCLWTAQRFLDLPDMDAQFQELLDGAAPAVDVTKGGVIQLTSTAMALLVEPSSSGQACSSAEQCAARLAAYCLTPEQGAASTGTECISSRVACALPMPEPPWGAPASEAPGAASCGARQGQAPVGLPPLNGQLPSAAGSMRGAAEELPVLAVPGSSHAVRELVGKVMHLMYLHGACGLFLVAWESHMRMCREAIHGVNACRDMLHHDPLGMGISLPSALLSMHEQVLGVVVGLQRAVLLSRLLGKGLQLHMNEMETMLIKEELSQLQRRLDRQRSSLAARHKAEVEARMRHLVQGAQVVEQVELTVLEEFMAAKNMLGALSSVDPSHWEGPGDLKAASSAICSFVSASKTCRDGQDYGDLLFSQRDTLEDCMGLMVDALEQGAKDALTELDLTLLPLREWSWCKLQLVEALLMRMCREHAPALLARAVLREVLPRVWRRQLASATATSSSAALEELLREEEEEARARAAAAGKAIKKKAKKQKAAKRAEKQEQQEKEQVAAEPTARDVSQTSQHLAVAHEAQGAQLQQGRALSGEASEEQPISEQPEQEQQQQEENGPEQQQQQQQQQQQTQTQTQTQLHQEEDELATPSGAAAADASEASEPEVAGSRAELGDMEHWEDPNGAYSDGGVDSQSSQLASSEDDSASFHSFDPQAEELEGEKEDGAANGSGRKEGGVSHAALLVGGKAGEGDEQRSSPEPSTPRRGEQSEALRGRGGGGTHPAGAAEASGLSSEALPPSPQQLEGAGGPEALVATPALQGAEGGGLSRGSSFTPSALEFRTPESPLSPAEAQEDSSSWPSTVLVPSLPSVPAARSEPREVPPPARQFRSASATCSLMQQPSPQTSLSIGAAGFVPGAKAPSRPPSASGGSQEATGASGSSGGGGAATDGAAAPSKSTRKKKNRKGTERRQELEVIGATWAQPPEPLHFGRQQSQSLLLPPPSQQPQQETRPEQGCAPQQQQSQAAVQRRQPLPRPGEQPVLRPAGAAHPAHGPPGWHPEAAAGVVGGTAQPPLGPRGRGKGVPHADGEPAPGRIRGGPRTDHPSVPARQQGRPDQCDPGGDPAEGPPAGDAGFGRQSQQQQPPPPQEQQLGQQDRAGPHQRQPPPPSFHRLRGPVGRAAEPPEAVPKPVQHGQGLQGVRQLLGLPSQHGVPPPPPARQPEPAQQQQQPPPPPGGGLPGSHLAWGPGLFEGAATGRLPPDLGVPASLGLSPSPVLDQQAHGPLQLPQPPPPTAPYPLHDLLPRPGAGSVLGGLSAFASTSPELPSMSGAGLRGGINMWGLPTAEPDVLTPQPQPQQTPGSLGLGCSSPSLSFPSHMFPQPSSGSRSSLAQSGSAEVFLARPAVDMLPLPHWLPQQGPEPAAVPDVGVGAEAEGTDDDLSAMLAAMGVGSSQDLGLADEEEVQQPWLAAAPRQPSRETCWTPAVSAAPPALMAAAGGAGPALAWRTRGAWGLPSQVLQPPAAPAHAAFSQPHATSLEPEAAPTAAVVDQVAGCLSNEAGEYNCFLNVIIQCLWHCEEFRQKVESWPADFFSADPVVHALRDLFVELGAQQATHHPRSRATAANPNRLREALAVLPGCLFRVGEMNDAGEVLLTVYEHVRRLELAQGQQPQVDAVFGLSVTEAVNCTKCGQTTHQNCYTQYFYNTQATSVRLQHLSNVEERNHVSMGRLLRQIESQSKKTCDTDASGCGKWMPITHFLDFAPRVFTLQLAWESQHQEGAEIAATLAGIQEQVDLGHVYHALEEGLHVYRLRSLVGYYGAHYFVFVMVAEPRRWLMFDDTRISNIGAFEDVRRKCEAGRIQPSLLLFEAQS